MAVSNKKQPQVKTKKAQFKPVALFEFAESQIENLVEQERLQGAKFSNLTDLERGRLIVKFMSFKNKPMTNRKFYEYFYNQ